jgi:SulP family sulfate permease
MLTGTFQILFGYLRLGGFITLMPYPVISGFMTGIGAILIIMQLDPLLGFEAPSNVMNALTVLPDYLAHPNWGALSVGLISLVVCFRTPRVLQRFIPPPLLALVLGTVVAFLLDVPVLGAVPSALPALQLPSIPPDLIGEMVVSALVLAALGSIDSLLTSLVAENATGTFHDSDKELVGQGLGNVMAGLAGGLPGAGATIRTLSNIQAGGRTALSGVIHALVLFAIALGLGPVVAHIPQAALAGVLCKVGVDVVDWRFIGRAHRVPRRDLLLMTIVFVLTVFVDIITAVGCGIILASLIFVKEAADLQRESIRTITHADDEHIFSEEEAQLLKQCGDAVLLVHLSGLMSFGAANEMARRFAALGHYDILILDLVDVPRIDGSAGLELEELIQRAVDNGREVMIVGLSFPVARVLTQTGSLELIKDTRRFATRKSALEAALSIVGAK